MRSLSDTLERLARYRRSVAAPSGNGKLRKLELSGRNPGELAAWHHIPERVASPVALVVVMHACTQTAAGYDDGSGWSKLAENFGFAVLFPEQIRQNNPNLCFNWFSSGDVARGEGEVESVREMIATMVANHSIGPNRIFVTGLSAGGAMANAMLAAYPEMFAGGAIIAGLPYGSASTIPQAFDRMRGHGLQSSAISQLRLRDASPHRGPWPTISVWHATADRTVDEVNAMAIVEQWSDAHDVPAEPTRREMVDGHERMIWVDKFGREVIELYRIQGMGHGTPLNPAEGYGKAGPFLLDVGVSSTEHIARGWGLTPSFSQRPREESPRTDTTTSPIHANNAQSVIEKALRSAGLMKSGPHWRERCDQGGSSLI